MMSYLEEWCSILRTIEETRGHRRLVVGLSAHRCTPRACESPPRIKSRLNRPHRARRVEYWASAAESQSGGSDHNDDDGGSNINQVPRKEHIRGNELPLRLHSGHETAVPVLSLFGHSMSARFSVNSRSANCQMTFVLWISLYMSAIYMDN